MIVLLVLIPLLAAIVAMAATSNRHRPLLLPITAIAHLALAAWLLPQGNQWAFDRWLAIDPLNRIFIGLISTLFLICAIYAPAYLRLRLHRDNRVLVACLLFALAMMSLVTLSHHLGLMWIAMEVTTLATAPCIYFNRNAKSLEATWKYLLICSVGIALALLGTFFLVYSMIQGGSESTLLLDELLEQSRTFSAPWLHAAFVLLLVGYGTKMGLSPMHTWKPDAYGEAPGVVGALLAGGLTSCAFLCVLRMFHVVHVAGAGQHAQRLLVFMGLLSMATAAVFLPRARDIKRLLAYSSVEHMGILVFGLGMGASSSIATSGAILHVIHNGLCKAGLFLAAANIHRAYRSKRTDLIDGILQRLPLSGWMMLILFFAITGSPPFGPFVSEFQILSGTFAAGYMGTGIAFLGLLLIVFFGMGSVILSFVQRPDEASKVLEEKNQFCESAMLIAPIALSLGLTVLLGFYTPPFLAAWVEQATDFLGRMP